MEKLTKQETEAYSFAVKALAEVEDVIRRNHGDVGYVNNAFELAYCGPRYYRNVTIKGGYALIDVKSYNPCSSTYSIKTTPAAITIEGFHISPK